MLSKQSGDGDDAEEGYYGYGMWIINNPGGQAVAFAALSPNIIIDILRIVCLNRKFWILVFQLPDLLHVLVRICQ